MEALLDSGSPISMIHQTIAHRLQSSLRPSTRQFTAVNGSPFEAKGTTRLPVTVLANIRTCLLSRTPEPFNQGATIATL
jgi:hypothetical protein